MRSNVTGGGLYNSEYRNFNRSFGRGNSKSFKKPQRQPSPQYTRKGDLVIEAGRLAVEYLVSHGFLSSNVLSGKGQNGNLRNNSRESKEHRCSQDKEVPNSPVAIANQDKRSPNDDDPSIARTFSRERSSLGASRSYSSEGSRENGKEGSLSDKVTVSQNMEADTNKFVKDDTKSADTDVHTSKDVGEGKPLHEMEKCNLDVDPDSKMTSLLQNKYVKELSKCSDWVSTGCEETKDGTSNLEMEKENSNDKLDNQHCEEKSDTSSKDCTDLLKLCTSAKIPTKVRSYLISKNSTSDPLLISEEQSSSDTMNDVTMNESSEIPSPNEIPGSNRVGNALNEQSFGDAGVLESGSFTDKTFFYEQKSGELPIAEDRGEKRALEEENMEEGAKKAKQWLSVAQSDLSAATVNIFNCSNQENFSNVSLPLNGGVESSVVDQVEEKQLFSSSFKICDLNLMEASDMHDNHDVPSLLYPSISAPRKDASIGIDLSMNNNCSLNNGYNDCGSARKDIEIIDLENESLQEGKSMPPRSLESDITSMGSFPNHAQNSNDNPDGQDGYGYMISELLGNDDPNCSSVQPHINSLHNDMGLHHGEGMFSEDDPIYMSLGEIPISLLRVWEQPSQERNPFGL